MKSLSLLIKPVSGSCNLRCRYCFYADVTDNRALKSHGIMSESTLEAVVKNALSEAGDSCVFGFQGGEPTLAGLDFYRTLIRLEARYNTKNIKISHAIQTNGMLIDDAWAQFLAENRFLVGLSIDGGKQVHDALRPDPQGKGTHSRCIQAARRLSRCKAEYNILSVVTRQLAAHPDKAYRFYKQQDFRHIQFIPCLDGLNEQYGAHPYSLDAEGYGRFLCRVFDLWYEDFVKDDYYSIRGFDNYIYMLAGYPAENCAMNGVCTAYPLVEADGGVYPCDFYAVDEYRLGSVHTDSFSEMLAGGTAQAFVKPSFSVPPVCRVCEYYVICRGGCRRDRVLKEDGSLGLNRYCESYKMFFSHSLERMKVLAKTL